MCLSPPIFSRQLLGTSISLSPTLNFLFVFRSLHLSHLHLLPPTLSKTWSLCYLFSLRLGHCVKSLLSKTWSLCHLFFHLSYFYSQYLFLTSQNSLSLSLSLSLCGLFVVSLALSLWIVCRIIHSLTLLVHSLYLFSPIKYLYSQWLGHCVIYYLTVSYIYSEYIFIPTWYSHSLSVTYSL